MPSVGSDVPETTVELSRRHLARGREIEAGKTRAGRRPRASDSSSSRMTTCRTVGASAKRSRRTTSSSSGRPDDAASAIAVADRLRPDICLIEIELPEDGLYAIGRISRSSPETLIIVLSRSERQDDVVNAFMRGASGYLLKGISGDRLAASLRAAHRGEPAVSRSLVAYLVDEAPSAALNAVSRLPGGAVTLTRREWEVGEMLDEGLSTGEIADRLGVSPVTVRRHVGLLLQKLGAEKSRGSGRADANLRPPLRSSAAIRPALFD